MRVLDLFSGIGGFSLGLERAGFNTVAFCEIDPYARAVLRKHWPDVPCYDDVRELTADRLAGDGIAVDVICGGFPCQDISTAGKGAGLAGERSGLWSEIARLVGELRPRYVIVENVSALLSRGLGTVLGDLAEIGYDAEWHCIPASAVGAPHRRDRVWIVAHPAQLQRNGSGVHAGSDSEGGRQVPEPRDGSAGADVADADEPRLEGWLRESMRECAGERVAWESCSPVADADECANVKSVTQPVQRPISEATTRSRDSLSWLSEPDLGRVAHGVPSFLDGLDLDPCLRAISMYASQSKISPAEALRMVRETYGEAEVFQWKNRSSDHVCSPQVLLPVLRRLDTHYKQEHSAQEGKETKDDSLRGVPDHEPTASASSGPGLPEQRGEQHPDPVQELSRFLAQHCQETWEKSRGSYAADRVSRLRCLGNAVVPQIPEIIGRAILEAERQ